MPKTTKKVTAAKDAPKKARKSKKISKASQDKKSGDEKPKLEK